jgi:two-component system sensor histidine kinase/response regulator
MTEPTLDRSALDRIVEMAGPDAAQLLEELLQAFAETAASCTAELVSAFRRGDPDTVRKKAHALKGAAANLGLLRTAALSGHLEIAAKNGALDSCVEPVAQLVDEVQAAHRAMRAYLDALAGGGA